MSIKIVNKKLKIEDEDVLCVYTTDITSFGNGAKLNCKKEFLNKKLKAYVVICK